ncbi:MAG: Holliday junction resolvase RuvX, partial [Actinobacteria bacterium]|nr:Holliday junction resolvase RuvX [Actinomycetota bacterium]
MKIMGLDIGEKKIGIAVSDIDEKLAIPLSVIDIDNKITYNLKKLIETNGIKTIIVGMPYTLRGEMGQQADK